MKALSEYLDYKEYIQARIKALPKQGRGEFRRLAQALGVHTTLISQIFNGPRDLTLEQAQEVCEYFVLSEREARIFLLLVDYARAGTVKLKAHFKREISRLQLEAQDLQKRLTQDKTLTPEEQARFYSRWTYSGIRLFSSVLTKQQARDPVRAISEALELHPSHVAQVLEYLVDRGLIKKPDGRAGFELGAQRIHVASDTPWVMQHHRNWRALTLARAEKSNAVPADDLLFTSPLTIAEADRPKVRKLILGLIDDVAQVVKGSDADSLSVLNIDWLKIAGN